MLQVSADLKARIFKEKNRLLGDVGKGTKAQVVFNLTLLEDQKEKRRQWEAKENPELVYFYGAYFMCSISLKMMERNPEDLFRGVDDQSEMFFTQLEENRKKSGRPNSR